MWSRLRRISAREDGVTVLEMVVATSVLLIVVTAMFTLFSVVQRTAARQEKRNQLNNEMRVAMDQMTKEIRQATKIYSGSTVSFIDMDTYVSGVTTRVSYTASGTQLSRTSGGITKILVTRMTTTTVFTYTPTTTEATDVVIDLSARPQQFQTDAAVVRLVSQVKLRNRRALA